MNRELFRLDEISIRGLCLELLQSLWMILVIGVSLWLGITGVHTLIFEPAYTSTATLVVTVKGESSAYSSLSVTSQMADVFGEVFQSSALRSRIIEDVGEEITGDITCTPITDTNLLTLSVSSPDPRQAYLFINSALENYERWQEMCSRMLLSRSFRSLRCLLHLPILPGSWPGGICWRQQECWQWRQ